MVFPLSRARNLVERVLAPRTKSTGKRPQLKSRHAAAGFVHRSGRDRLALQTGPRRRSTLPSPGRPWEEIQVFQIGAGRGGRKLREECPPHNRPRHFRSLLFLRAHLSEAGFRFLRCIQSAPAAFSLKGEAASQPAQSFDTYLRDAMAGRSRSPAATYRWRSTWAALYEENACAPAHAWPASLLALPFQTGLEALCGTLSSVANRHSGQAAGSAVGLEAKLGKEIQFSIAKSGNQRRNLRRWQGRVWRTLNGQSEPRRGKSGYRNKLMEKLKLGILPDSDSPEHFEKAGANSSPTAFTGRHGDEPGASHQSLSNFDQFGARELFKAAPSLRGPRERYHLDWPRARREATLAANCAHCGRLFSAPAGRESVGL